MSYAPRPGSKTETAIAFIQKRGSARTDDIVQATGIGRDSLNTLLRPAVDAGVLVCCKVEQPGKPPTNEYRPGSGLPALTQRAELKPSSRLPRRDPQPAVGQNTGSAPSGLLPEQSSSADGRAVATSPAPAPKGRELGPAAARAPASNAMDITIDQDGAVTFCIPNEPPIELDPGQTLALGHFLISTEPLWRPQ